MNKKAIAENKAALAAHADENKNREEALVVVLFTQHWL
jgi:hypothetical protein